MNQSFTNFENENIVFGNLLSVLNKNDYHEFM
jgi:hypothetical protein